MRIKYEGGRANGTAAQVTANCYVVGYGPTRDEMQRYLRTERTDDKGRIVFAYTPPWQGCSNGGRYYVFRQLDTHQAMLSDSRNHYRQFRSLAAADKAAAKANNAELALAQGLASSHCDPVSGLLVAPQLRSLAARLDTGP